MDLWLSEMRQEGVQRMELQTIFLDEYTCIGIPAEFFVELGLRIKEGAHPRHALIFGLANGMVGYVPTREAFARGGYETTFWAGASLRTTRVTASSRRPWRNAGRNKRRKRLNSLCVKRFKCRKSLKSPRKRDDTPTLGGVCGARAWSTICTSFRNTLAA